MRRVIASAPAILAFSAGIALAQSAQPPGATQPPDATPPMPATASGEATTVAPAADGSAKPHVVATPSSSTRASPTGGGSGGGQ